MSTLRLFSTPRAYDPGSSGEYAETQYIELDETDFGADRFFDKRNGNPASAAERDEGLHRRRAQAELRRKRFDFSQLLQHWK